jgi:hypothetical protein
MSDVVFERVILPVDLNTRFGHTHAFIIKHGNPLPGFQFHLIRMLKADYPPRGLEIIIQAWSRLRFFQVINYGIKIRNSISQKSDPGEVAWLADCVSTS